MEFSTCVWMKEEKGDVENVLREKKKWLVVVEEETTASPPFCFYCDCC